MADTIETDVILKLFDTLKESNGILRQSVEKQTDAIMHLSGLLKEGVGNDELKAIIEEYNKHQGGHLDNIDTCTESISTESGNIKTILEGMGKKLNNVIIAILVAFAIMGVAFFISNAYVKSQVESRFQQYQEGLKQPEHKEIFDEIERLRRDLRSNKDASTTKNGGN